MEQLNWNNLKKYHCPRCGIPLTDNTLAAMKNHLCMNCHFTITDAKLTEIITRKPKAYVKPDRSNWE